MFSPAVTVDLIGSESAVDRLGRTAAMIRVLPSSVPEIFDVLEKSEERLFDSWHGKYVDTGRTRGSLTQRHHPDAIRELHGPQLVFGTSVDYARYLREGGRSAVLRIDQSTVSEIEAVVAAQINLVARVRGFASHFTARFRR
jgi:hypothetical protein